jgi:hypothetical protein
MTVVESARAIGSDMETVGAAFLRAAPHRAPWEDERMQTVHVETGRQALALLAHELASTVDSTLLVPAYLCDSMIDPFLDRGWRVEPYRMTDDLRVDEAHLRSLAAGRSRPFAVLLALYFGREPDAAYRSLVVDLQRAGATVIDDETHRVFSPGDSGADFAVASLRKTLPLADGAYLRGPGDHAILPAGPESPRWAAMDAKGTHLAGHTGDQSFARLFAEANHALEASDTPRGIGERTEGAIAHLDYDLLRGARQANAQALSDELVTLGAQVVNSPGDELLPSHLVVSVPDPKSVQRAMAASGVYCPIHWPPSERLDVGPWPSRFLSLPVDHRYTPTDMSRAASVFAEAVA